MCCGQKMQSKGASLAFFAQFVTVSDVLTEMAEKQAG